MIKKKYNIYDVMSSAIKVYHLEDTRKLMSLALLCRYCKEQNISLEAVDVRLSECESQIENRKTNVIGEMMLGVNSYI